MESSEQKAESRKGEREKANAIENERERGKESFI